MDDKERDHESFGVIGWSRVNGSRSNLFGSSLQHNGWIEITVQGAREIRSSTHDTRFSPAGCPIHLQVCLSEAQFAAFLTTPNRGEGVPCTVQRIGERRLEECPKDEEQIQFREELDSVGKDILLYLTEAMKKVEEMLRGPSPKKGDLKEVKGKLEATYRDLQSNLPFLLEQYNGYMDSVFFDAVARFEGHVKSMTEQLGLEHLQEKQNKLSGE